MVLLGNVSAVQRALIAMGLMVILAVVALGVARAEAQERNLVCRNPDRVIGGFGSWETGCDAEAFGDIGRIKYIYPKFVFDRNVEDPASRKEYVTNMTALIKKMARDYIRQREPKNPKAAEIEGFAQTMVTVATVESYLSHYRIGFDGHYKLMTGDKLVSHGMMQINQNFHANRELDSSFDLVGNIVAGLDTFYVEWEKAPRSECYKSMLGKNPTIEKIIEVRARSAYSAYNGGPGKLCRFANPKDPYAAHDRNFHEIYKKKPWESFVTEPNRQVGLNVKCLMEGDDLCAIAKKSRSEYLQGRPIVFENGLTCITKDGKTFDCAPDLRMFSCMANYPESALKAGPVKMKAPKPEFKLRKHTNRDALCSIAARGLVTVGHSISVKKDMILRERIGGKQVGGVFPNNVVQVVDYEVQGSEGERYYRVRMQDGVLGWIFGGNSKDHDQWAVLSKETPKVAVPVATQPAPAAQQAATAQPKSTQPTQQPAPVAVAQKPAASPSPSPAPQKPAQVAQQPAPAPAPAKQAATSVTAKPADATTVGALPALGSTISVVKSGGIPLRPDMQTAVENEIAHVPEKTTLKVQAIEKQGTANEIYLLVTYNGKRGFIYAGRTFPEVTTDKWVKVVQ